MVEVLAGMEAAQEDTVDLVGMVDLAVEVAQVVMVVLAVEVQAGMEAALEDMVE